MAVDLTSFASKTTVIPLKFAFPILPNLLTRNQSGAVSWGSGRQWGAGSQVGGLEIKP